MICHSQIATDKPLIQEVTAYADKGIEIPWQRVYGFTHESHVRFNHAPHIRASVDCATCHGDLNNQTVAERVVDHNMILVGVEDPRDELVAKIEHALASGGATEIRRV